MNSLSELKKIIQAMNETVTDKGIAAFQNEILRLGRQNENHPAVASLLKMMQPLGTYLGSKKGTAHADSIPVLNSIADTLENVITNPGMAPEDAGRMVSEDLEKYKSLKNKIASRPEINAQDMNDLKAVILAIDWEISDTTLENFETVLTRLLSKLSPYKIHHTFLKIIHSTGRFIGIQQANAPADAISFLRSVFENFDRIVQTPDMSFKDKKEMLESDINRFHEFKQMISTPKRPDPSKTDISEDEPFQPALSHIKTAGRQTSEEPLPLTVLPEQGMTPLPAGDSFLEEAVEPALANRKKPSAGPRDIMDDLFSMKESPADELLDAIHLMDVHGPNQGESMNMRGQADLPAAGIKTFTPRQKDNAPIPEIGSRLDEFFNLDLPGDASAPEIELPEPELDPLPREADEPFESIVPFQDEDESFEEGPLEIDDDLLGQDRDSEVLTRLNAAIETADFCSESSLKAIYQDISYLEKQWQADPDKSGLLRIIVSCLGVLKDKSKALDLTKGERPHEADDGVTPEPREKNRSLWGKIKGIFSS